MPSPDVTVSLIECMWSPVVEPGPMLGMKQAENRSVAKRLSMGNARRCGTAGGSLGCPHSTRASRTAGAVRGGGPERHAAESRPPPILRAAE